jgi:hypothetical protein
MIHAQEDFFRDKKRSFVERRGKKKRYGDIDHLLSIPPPPLLFPRQRRRVEGGK